MSAFQSFLQTGLVIGSISHHTVNNITFRWIQFNTVNIHCTEGMYFLIFTVIATGMIYRMTQSSIILNCTIYFLPSGTVFLDTLPWVNQEHILAWKILTMLHQGLLHASHLERHLPQVPIWGWNYFKYSLREHTFRCEKLLKSFGTVPNIQHVTRYFFHCLLNISLLLFWILFQESFIYFCNIH